ncbi:hypothetical protein CLOSTHATH_02440 [Hungatella hathewayi DSM 13479]|uniref:Uncharacterized protein n=1 Tax=Hungatella hathewayi DSM 13479 TaxID=566550 RepID=D3AFQ5_9FIRM|nr:hypothetical protein CLOSTHATH_02440 [Hungatella hathewayi DSM 13479]
MRDRRPDQEAAGTAYTAQGSHVRMISLRRPAWHTVRRFFLYQGGSGLNDSV